jgi:hypothetical protein
MFDPTPLFSLRRLLVVGAVVVGATASAAGAVVPNPDGDPLPASAPLVTRPPDVQDAATAAALQTTPAGLKADGLRWQGIAKVYQGMQAAPDVVERYAATHQSGGRLAVPSTAASAPSRPPDITDTASTVGASAPDVFERYARVHADDPSSSTPSVSRPPDVADAALAVRYAPTASVQPNGFDWSDWAIGIGSGLGLALILGAAVLMGRQLRHRDHVQTA